MTKPEENVVGTLSEDEPELHELHIADEDLEVVDTSSKAAKKRAKKLAKSQLSDADLKSMHRKKLLIVVAAILTPLLVLLAVPRTRWIIINAFGVRSTMRFVVTENKEGKPVSNAAITLDETYFTTTDSDGKAKFENAKFGKHQIKVTKNGYSREDQAVSVGFSGSKTEVQLTTIGIKVNLDIKNWLTAEPIEGATVGLADDSVTSDKTGRASIVVPPDKGKVVKLQVAAPGYQTKTVPLNVGVEAKEVSLISSAKDYFISKREGKYDIFGGFVDGTGQQKLVSATGKEDADLIQFSMHRGNRFGILVANRDGTVKNGRVVAGVYVIDFSNAALRKIDDGSDVRLLEWGDDTIVYQKTDPNLNYDDPAFTKLVSFNPLNNRQKQLAQSNYFSCALVAQDKVYYAGADGYRDGNNTPLTSIDLTRGTTKTYLESTTPASLTRSDFNNLTLLTYDSQYFNIYAGSGAARSIDRRVDSTRQFSLSPDAKQVLWAENRDGQGTLLVRPVSTGDERAVAKLSGLTYPIRFVSDRLAVVRVVTTTETADYLVDVPTGKTAKVVDVSDIRNVGSIL